MYRDESGEFKSCKKKICVIVCATKRMERRINNGQDVLTKRKMYGKNLNPLLSNSNQHQIPVYNSNAFSVKEVIRMM